MSRFDVDKVEITAFGFGETYPFKAYFSDDQLFQQPKRHYKSDNYCHKTLKEELDNPHQFLNWFPYELVTEGNLKDYPVVASKEADSNSIIRNSVMRKQRGQHEIHFINDKSSFGQAIEKGATEVEKTGVTAGNYEWKTGGS